MKKRGWSSLFIKTKCSSLILSTKCSRKKFSCHSLCWLGLLVKIPLHLIWRSILASNKMPCLYWLKLQVLIREMNKVVLWLLQCIWLDFHKIPMEVRPNPFISDGRIASALTFSFLKQAATDLKNVIKIRRGWYGKIIMKKQNE